MELYSSRPLTPPHSTDAAVARRIRVVNLHCFKMFDGAKYKEESPEVL